MDTLLESAGGYAALIQHPGAECSLCVFRRRGVAKAIQLTHSWSVQSRSLWVRPWVLLPVAVPYPNAAPFLPILSELQRGIVQPTGWARAPGPVALSPEPSIAGSHPPGRHSIVVGS